MNKLSEKIQLYAQKFLALLRVRSVVVGLEVSDEVIRLVYFDGQAWQLYAIRLAPGVLEHGKIKDRIALISSLVALRAKTKMGGGDKGRKINAVLSLSSANPYSQVFSLPIMEGEELDKAIALNIKMASPTDASQVYSGWQVVGKNENALQVEILSAFIDRAIVDEMVDALFAAGFVAMAVESRALALARVLREKGAAADITKPYLLVSVDNSGLDFLVVRNGQLYFEYSNPWADIVDEKGEVAIDKFQTELTASLRQVVNFYNQHWTEPINAVVISAAAFQDEIEGIVSGNFALPAVRLTLLMGQPISSEWLVALGSSLRGMPSEERQKEISLLGEDLEDRFREEQVLHFMRFWQVLVPATFCFFALFFIASDLFLMNLRTQIESAPTFNLSDDQATQLQKLEGSATAFNNQVAMVAGIQSSTMPKYEIIEALQTITTANQITISHLTFPGGGAAVQLSGIAPSEDDIVAFKMALSADPRFTAINLPLGQIQPSAAAFSFSLTFIYTP